MLTFVDRRNEVVVLLRVAKAVDARHGRNDERVPSGQQRAGSRVTQAVYLIVDGGVLGYVRVRTGDVGLWLVVIVVGDEVLHSVVGQEVPKLRGELCSKRLVVGDDQGRSLQQLRDFCHGEGLAAAGDAHKGLVAFTTKGSFSQRLNRLRLVACWHEV